MAAGLYFGHWPGRRFTLSQLASGLLAQPLKDGLNKLGDRLRVAAREVVRPRRGVVEVVCVSRLHASMGSARKSHVFGKVVQEFGHE